MTYKYFPATLSACILVATGVHAQRNLEVGIAMGADHFSGDLGNYDGAVQWNGIRPGMKVTFRDYLNNIAKKKNAELLEKTPVASKCKVFGPGVEKAELLDELRKMKHAFDAIKTTDAGKAQSLEWQTLLY